MKFDLAKLWFALLGKGGAAFGQLIADKGKRLGQRLHLERGLQRLGFQGQVPFCQGEGMRRRLTEFLRQLDGTRLGAAIGRQLIGKSHIDRVLAF